MKPITKFIYNKDVKFSWLKKHTRRIKYKNINFHIKMFFSVSHSIKIFSYFKLHFYRDSLKRHWDWGLHIMHVINWISTLSVWWLQDIFFYLRSFSVHLYWKLISVMCSYDKWHEGCLIVNGFLVVIEFFQHIFEKDFMNCVHCYIWFHDSIISCNILYKYMHNLSNTFIDKPGSFEVWSQVLI